MLIQVEILKLAHLVFVISMKEFIVIKGSNKSQMNMMTCHYLRR